MLLNIGEAARLSGVPPKTIRYYEEIKLISPTARKENGYRVYDEKEVAFLRFVGRARQLGFGLDDVAALLALYRNKSRSSKKVKQLALEHVAKLDQKIREMATMRAAIVELAERCSDGDRPDCPIIDELASGRGRIRREAREGRK